VNDYGSSVDAEKYQGKPPASLVHFFNEVQKSSGFPAWSHEEEHEGARGTHPGKCRQTESLYQAGQPLAGRSFRELEI
jgi:hypothetical protein